MTRNRYLMLCILRLQTLALSEKRHNVNITEDEVLNSNTSDAVSVTENDSFSLLAIFSAYDRLVPSVIRPCDVFLSFW